MIVRDGLDLNRISFTIEKQGYKDFTIAHWYRFPVFVQQFFFSRFLADFDAQYGKLGVFWVEEFIFGKKYRAPLGIRT